MSMSDKEAINYFFDVLILIILEVLYESKWKNKRTFKNCLNPYYTGSTLWDKLKQISIYFYGSLNPYYTGSTLWAKTDTALVKQINES